MATKVITPQVDWATKGALGGRLPDGLTASEWMRLMVEVLVSWPAESEAQAELKDLVENPHRRAGMEIKSGPYKVHFRLREDYWLVLATLAQAAGRSRTDYLRTLIYMGTAFPWLWYSAYKKEEASYIHGRARF